MKYKFLGKTGVQVSYLSFGCMTFGGEADEKTSSELYQECRRAGINFFDCANMYQTGKAEEILGNLIRHERQEVIITSKAYYPMGAD
ncbi:MAG TPA: aldo/keto reductase, partial [Chlamydiales bacterium]|nr:aldo/keto reductase [Chlamydiales bacterium]